MSILSFLALLVGPAYRAKLALQDGGTTLRTEAPKTFTTAKRRQIVLDAFKAFGARKMRTPRNVERAEGLENISTEGTILSLAVEALNAAGDPTEQNLGALGRKLELSQVQFDNGFCYCLNGATISGSEAARRIKQFF